MKITIYNTNKVKAPVDPDNPTEGTENKTSLKSKLPEHNIDFLYKFQNRTTTSKSVLHKRITNFHLQPFPGNRKAMK